MNLHLLVFLKFFPLKFNKNFKDQLLMNVDITDRVFQNNFFVVKFLVAIMPYRINGQYIMEGLGASFMFCLGGENFYIFLREL